MDSPETVTRGSPIVCRLALFFEATGQETMHLGVLEAPNVQREYENESMRIFHGAKQQAVREDRRSGEEILGRSLSTTCSEHLRQLSLKFEIWSQS